MSIPVPLLNTKHTQSSGLSQIIAVVSSSESIDENKVRQDVQEIIPEYMVPSKVVVLEDLPKNPNGKVDRKRLSELYNRPN